MAPPEATPAFLPAPATILDRLPASVVARLGESTAVVTQKSPEWSAVLSELDKNGGFVGMGSWEVNSLAYHIAVEQRAALSKQLLGMMRAADIPPDTLTFDLLMLAHAAVEEPEEVKKLFEDLKESKNPLSYHQKPPLKKYHRRPSTNSLQLRPPPKSLLPTIRRRSRNPRRPRNAHLQHPPQPRRLLHPNPNLPLPKPALDSLGDLQPHKAKIYLHSPRRTYLHAHDPRLRG